MPQQTAIEKLIESLEYWNINIDCKNLFRQICIQALELEKEQIKKAYNANYFNGVLKFETSEEYFNKIYKK
jgi:hypothetical protein